MTLAADDIKKIRTELEVVTVEIDQLGDWETTFIESISDTFDRTGELTPRQIDKLHQIYEKVC